MGKDFYWNNSDGLRLFARTWQWEDASRPAVLCIHGLTQNSLMFAEVGPLLAREGFRVAAMDVRGRGFSEWDAKHRYDLATYARDAAELLSKLGAARVAVVGTSMGGNIACQLATARPELLRGAVLNDIGPEIAKEGIDRIVSYAGKGTDIKSWKGQFFVCFFSFSFFSFFPLRCGSLFQAHLRCLLASLFRLGRVGPPAVRSRLSSAIRSGHFVVWPRPVHESESSLDGAESAGRGGAGAGGARRAVGHFGGGDGGKNGPGGGGATGAGGGSGTHANADGERGGQRND